MAEIQATCLYDFDGDVQNGELTFYAGDVLTIIRQDIGDGWWEARNARGEQGLIPETYVEIASIPEPAFPPPPPPPSAASMPSAPPASLMNKGFSNGLRDSWGGTSSADTRIEPQASFDGWDDDDWEDQDDDASSNSTMGTTAAQRIKPLLDFQVYEEVQTEQGPGNFGLSTPKREKKQISPTELSRYGTVKSSFSRFSQFAKSGGEAFMTGQLDANVPDSDRIKIIDTPEGPCWQCPDSQYTCSVASPKKESKMKGLKSYIAYQLTPSFSNIQVSRRYKHFDWLHERLLAKFPCIPIPPLPDKQVTGRYEEDFVQERMKFLQMWVDRMVRHPVICRSDVFLHFLTCTDGKQKWKQGKRKAEKDEFQGFKFFLTLDKPQRALEMHDVDAKMEVFCKFVYGMNENAKQLYSVIHEYAKKQIGPFKREYSKIGSSFKQLALTFNLDTNEASKQLTTAIDRTGDAYNDIGIMFERQPSVEAYPFLDSLLEYKGLLQTYPDVLKVHEGTVGKAKECLKLQEEGKIADDEVHKVLSRADTISYGTLAEMNHFQRERVKDFKLMMQLYLRQQIGFYKDMTKKLENALQEYDSVNIPR